MSGSARSGGDHLWEDNWDDDDIEDEFSVALRYVLSGCVHETRSFLFSTRAKSSNSKDSNTPSAELAKTDTVQPMST